MIESTIKIRKYARMDMSFDREYIEDQIRVLQLSDYKVIECDGEFFLFW